MNETPYISSMTDDVTGAMVASVKNNIAEQYETTYSSFSFISVAFNSIPFDSMTPKKALIVGVPAALLLLFVVYELISWIGFLLNFAGIGIVIVFGLFVVHKLRTPDQCTSMGPVREF